MTVAKKKPASYLELYKVSSEVSSEKRAVDDLRQKISGLLERDPQMARKAALILELWLRQKSK